jgi:hypothetical protein
MWARLRYSAVSVAALQGIQLQHRLRVRLRLLRLLRLLALLRERLRQLEVGHRLACLLLALLRLVGLWWVVYLCRLL